MSDTENQDMIDTQALRLATAANTRAKDLVDRVEKGFKKIDEWQVAHEKHDDKRFGEVTEKISKGFGGVYSRLWAFAFLILAGMGGVALLLLDKVIPNAGG